MFRFIQMAGLMLATTILAGPHPTQDRAADFRARFARESDPLRKAKMMPQYGDLEFQEIQNAIEEGNLPQALEQSADRVTVDERLIGGEQVAVFGVQNEDETEQYREEASVNLIWIVAEHFAICG